jgi:nicotinic acid mononucleotide adenylyltransferase
MNPMGIFGGTFDPIHYAHLRTAFELQQALRLKEIRFPAGGQSAAPRQPFAEPQQRLKMVQLAVPRSAGFPSTIARCAKRAHPIRWRPWPNCATSIRTAACV